MTIDMNAVALVSLILILTILVSITLWMIVDTYIFLLNNVPREYPTTTKNENCQADEKNPPATENKS